MPRSVLLGLCLLVSLGTGCLTAIVGPIVPALAYGLHVREDSLGVVFGANFLLASAATALAGPIFDRSGPRMLLPAGLLAMALGAMGEGLAPSLPFLALAAALAGFGGGVINVGVNVTASLLYPERSERVLNIINALFGAGAFLAPVLAGLALARLGGYRPAYIAVAMLLALPILPLALGLPQRSQRQRRDRAGRGRGTRALLARRGLWAPMTVGFLYLGAEIGFGGWIVAILRRTAHVSAQDAAPAVALFWLCLALGGLPTAYLLRRGTAPTRIIGWGAAGAACATAVLALFGANVPLALAACALVGFSFAPIFPLTIAAAARVGGSASAAGGATALMLVAAQLGAATLPPLQGFLLEVGPAPALTLTCVCSLLILATQGLFSVDPHGCEVVAQRSMP